VSPTLRRFWTWVLIVAGGLMLLLCGSCTAWWMTEAIGEIRNPAPGYEGLGELVLLITLIVGGFPTVLGLLFLLLGLKRRKATPSR
jgi:hypothetical protein